MVFFRYSTNKTDCHDITEILLKMALRHHKTKLTFVRFHKVKSQSYYLYLLALFFAVLSSAVFWFSSIIQYLHYPNNKIRIFVLKRYTYVHILSMIYDKQKSTCISGNILEKMRVHIIFFQFLP
jgi:hypothetical protein